MVTAVAVRVSLNLEAAGFADQKACQHSFNDAEPSESDLKQASQDSVNYIQEFLDQIFAGASAVNQAIESADERSDGSDAAKSFSGFAGGLSSWIAAGAAEWRSRHPGATKVTGD